MLKQTAERSSFLLWLNWALPVLYLDWIEPFLYYTLTELNPSHVLLWLNWTLPMLFMPALFYLSLFFSGARYPKMKRNVTKARPSASPRKWWPSKKLPTEHSAPVWTCIHPPTPPCQITAVCRLLQVKFKVSWSGVQLPVHRAPGPILTACQCPRKFDLEPACFSMCQSVCLPRSEMFYFRFVQSVAIVISCWSIFVVVVVVVQGTHNTCVRLPLFAECTTCIFSECLCLTLTFCLPPCCY